jgi:hypothetical protein
MTKIVGSGSISLRHGSPDPPQHVMDPQHCRDENCVELLELADRHHGAELKRAALRHIKAGFRIRMDPH